MSEAIANMGPIKVAAKTRGRTSLENATLGVSTRSKNSINNLKITIKQAVKTAGKRKAGSPLRDATAKRAAFGDITNAIVNNGVNEKGKNLVKKVIVNEKQLPVVKVVKKKYADNKIPGLSKVFKGQTVVTNENNVKRSDKTDLFKTDPFIRLTNKVVVKNAQKVNGHDAVRISDEFSEESLYVSAVEDIGNESKQSTSSKNDKESSLTRDINLLAISEKPPLPKGVTDFDKENWNDPFQVSNYAMDIFNYLKNRESRFIIEDYLSKQKNISTWMRAMLVDWMVEVQESFELNHETLYLAVKLVDLYLSKATTKQDELQLLGAASLFIASKFDECIPPLLKDFVYICDGAYDVRQILSMEINVLKMIDYDLGIPLSYRFLRRYARCAKVSMPILTLARFVLEFCLMEYSLISQSDSKMAAAALFLAIKMKNLGTWTSTHVYYTGYTLEEILPIVKAQNTCLHKKPKDVLSTVRNKYSHKIFFEVAKIPLVSNEELT